MTRAAPVSIQCEFALASTANRYLRIPHGVVCVATSVGIAVYSPSAALLFEGPDARKVVESLFPLLDGTRTAADQCAAMPEIDATGLRGLLEDLRDNGLVIAAPSRASFALEEKERSVRLRNSHVAVVGEAQASASLANAIRAAGVGNVTVGENDVLEQDLVPDLVVGTFGSGATGEVFEFSQKMHRRGFRSLACVLHLEEVLIGPLTIPGDSPCWNCGATRMAANAGWSDRAMLRNGVVAEIEVVITALLAREVCEVLEGSGRSARVIEHVLALDKATLQTSLHRVTGVPDCPICGGPPVSRASFGECNGSKFAGTSTQLATDYVSWFVDARTGIVNRIVLEDVATTGVPTPMVVTAVPADAPVSSGPRRAIPAGWGKGTTLEAATVSAIGEAIERYCASMPDVHRIVWSPPAALTGDALRPDVLALYGEDQYARREFPFVRFDPKVAHPWVAGEWLADRTAVWVPAVLAFLALDISREHSFCQGTSSGLAAGMDRSEAALRAILELLERDAFMTSWRTQQSGQRIYLDQTLDPDLQAIVAGLNALGARVELVLLRSPGGYPTAVALGFGDGIKWPGATLGLATDPAPGVAVRQAILELGQTGPYLRRMMLEGKQPAPASVEDVKEMLDHARYYFLPEHACALDYLWDTTNSCSFADLPGGSERSLAAVAERLTAAGVRVALVDVTSSDVATRAVWVMRAVSPDLQPIAFGYGLERLPVPRLAAISTAITENRIAPIW